ncbi:unnamed protein product [Closterium sp. NIES-64]|nr:unnamed protein product [Closterium sp. NIES-64]
MSLPSHVLSLVPLFLPPRLPPPLGASQAYACNASEEEMRRYLDFEAQQLCPDDWFHTQDLLFANNCFALPTRRCLTRTSQQLVGGKGGCGGGKGGGPTPFQESLFSQGALKDGAVQLDAGGGTGSFAAHMARYNVTVMTTAMNIETVTGRRQGLPYMETIALRGLISLHVPHKMAPGVAGCVGCALSAGVCGDGYRMGGGGYGVYGVGPHIPSINLQCAFASPPLTFSSSLRPFPHLFPIAPPSRCSLPPDQPLQRRLPFMDGMLDMVHCVNSIKYLPIQEFEELLYDWDRVLRVGACSLPCSLLPLLSLVSRTRSPASLPYTLPAILLACHHTCLPSHLACHSPCLPYTLPAITPCLPSHLACHHTLPAITPLVSAYFHPCVLIIARAMGPHPTAALRTRHEPQEAEGQLVMGRFHSGPDLKAAPPRLVETRQVGPS